MEPGQPERPHCETQQLLEGGCSFCDAAPGSPAGGPDASSATAAGAPSGFAISWRFLALCGVGVAAVAACTWAVHLQRGSQVEPRRTELVNFEGAPLEGATLVETAKGGGKLEPKDDVDILEDFDFSGPVVDIDPAKVDQEIMGFGGAFTEAAAVIFDKLSPEHQEELLDKYFGEGGIGYSIGRVHINSCDFSEDNYNFDDEENDWDLVHFDDGVEHDTKSLIPLIKRAAEKADAAGRDLRLLASPWSPPAWMKTNGQMDTSDLPNGLKEECSAVWAKYISRWISAYKNHQINIRWLTVQNEPMNAPGWEACAFSPEDEAEFLGAHLGPTLREDHPDVGIFVFDDSKHNMHAYVSAAYEHEEAKKYVEGAAFHWYTGDLFENVLEVHKLFPEAKLLPSEATYERRRWEDGKERAYSDWRFGEGYARDIIGDLNAGAVGWMDWNLLLDADGGPNHVGNVCDAAMVATEDKKALAVHPQYYYIGHFSKYLLVGSKHLRTTVKGSVEYTEGNRDYGTCTGDDGLQATAFKRPDGQIAVVALNCGDDEIEFKIRKEKRALRCRIPPHAIQTYLIPPEGLEQASQSTAPQKRSASAVLSGSNEQNRQSAGSTGKASRPLLADGTCCFAGTGGSDEDTCSNCPEAAFADSTSMCGKSRVQCLACSSGSATWCPAKEKPGLDEALGSPAEVLKKFSESEPVRAQQRAGAGAGAGGGWRGAPAAAGALALAVALIAVAAVVGCRRAAPERPGFH